jgi:hypothetical protein
MSSTKRSVNEVPEKRRRSLSSTAPSLGIDIDGCVDEAPEFFRVLTQVWPGRVFVMSYRHDRARAKADLQHYGIRHDELILVSSLEGKAEVIAREEIQVFFDDQPECLKGIDSMRNVMLVRNGGNFDFEDGRWILSRRTGKLVV